MLYTSIYNVDHVLKLVTNKIWSPFQGEISIGTYFGDANEYNLPASEECSGKDWKEF